MSDSLSRGKSYSYDGPDPKDFSAHHARVRQLLNKMRPRQTHPPRQHSQVDDLRNDFWPVLDRRSLRCSAACACVGLMEYFRLRVRGAKTRLSARFVYEVTRRLDRETGDTAATLRSTLKAIAKFGIPLEDYCPHDTGGFGHEPSSFAFACARSEAGIVYFRPVDSRRPGTVVLEALKLYLSAGLPILCAFGFPAPRSQNAYIDFRPENTEGLDPQAVVAVGYDDEFGVTAGEPVCPKGAILFRNSWGAAWGDNGYGWLPYEYVKRNLVTDYWTILREDWADNEQFCHPFIFRREFARAAEA